MKIDGTRFGDIEFDTKNIIHFPEGLIGFEDLRNFVVMPNRQEGPLFWIQSIEDSDVAFLLTDPQNFFLDYTVSPSKNDLAKLEVKLVEECYALTVISLQPDKSVTLNLAAPVIFSPKSNRALQVILEGAPYNTRTPLQTV